MFFSRVLVFLGDKNKIMKQLTCCFLVLLLLCSCNDAQPKAPSVKTSDDLSAVASEVEISEAGSIPSLSFSELAPIFNKQDDKTYIINFWATWCKPCVEELPYFEAVNEKYKMNDVEVILVSLDFPNQLHTGLKNFVQRKKIQSKVIHLNDPDHNTWIPKIDSNWDGAIPATVIYNSKKRMFYGKSFTQDALETELKQYIQ
jgi:thiol-disulfide isomerase/thioredoxin